jgi:hypothetical protein
VESRVRVRRVRRAANCLLQIGIGSLAELREGKVQRSVRCRGSKAEREARRSRESKYVLLVFDIFGMWSRLGRKATRSLFFHVALIQLGVLPWGFSQVSRNCHLCGCSYGVI